MKKLILLCLFILVGCEAPYQPPATNFKFHIHEVVCWQLTDQKVIVTELSYSGEDRIYRIKFYKNHQGYPEEIFVWENELEKLVDSKYQIGQTIFYNAIQKNIKIEQVYPKGESPYSTNKRYNPNEQYYLIKYDDMFEIVPESELEKVR